MTPAIRAVQNAKVAYKLHEYEHKEGAESYGLEAAVALGVEPERVFKTLVARVDGGGLAVGIIPASARLDLKALAAAIGGKKAEMADPAAAERATGYVVGGISPLGQRKLLPTVLDQSALGQETIFISAGRRGMQIELAPSDVRKLTNGEVAPITSAAY